MFPYARRNVRFGSEVVIRDKLASPKVARTGKLIALAGPAPIAIKKWSRSLGSSAGKLTLTSCGCGWLDHLIKNSLSHPFIAGFDLDQYARASV